jgi:DNA-binding LacI/PurR family transcriptional regulator
MPLAPYQILPVFRHLHTQIVNGQFAPGQRLPSRRELQRRYRVSVATVHRAIEMLEQQGFVRSQQGAGSFVVDHPPHLCHYALVFHAIRRWSQLYSSIAAAGREMSQNPATQFIPYGSHESDHMDRLEAEVAARRLAGMIFVHPSRDVIRSRGLDRCEVPVAYVGSWTHGDRSVDFDLESFFRQAMAYLKARGRRRVAVVYAQWTGQDSSLMQRWTDLAAAEAGIDAPELLRVPMAGLAGVTAGATTIRLLMRLPTDERPDAIIVSDDNLLEQVSSGLKLAGVRVPEDVLLMSACNYPSPVACSLPVVRLGFDCRRVLAAAVESLRGPASRAPLRIEPEFMSTESDRMLLLEGTHA